MDQDSTFRRISAANIPIRSASASPSDSRTTNASAPDATAATNCLGCDGTGWYTLRVPVGHPHFGTLIRCECQQGSGMLPEQVRMLALLSRELGRYATCAFATFNPDRALQPLTWQGHTFTIAEQRDYLHDARQLAETYAAQLDGWLYLFGSGGAGRANRTWPPRWRTPSLCAGSA